jgi:hypothetical protein
MYMTQTLRITILLMSISLWASAQNPINWQWTFAAGSVGQDNVTDMVVDQAGNSIIVGKFGGPFTIATNPPTTLQPHGIYDMYIAKFNSSGNVLWVKTPYAPAQDFATAVDIDKQGNIYMLADFYDSLVYDSNATGLQVFQSNSGLSNIYLAKYSPNGNLVWAKNIGGSSIDQSSDLKVDTSGNVFVTGSFYGTSYFNKPVSNADTLKSRGQGDIFIAKYKSDGSFVWVKQIGSNSFENSSSITTTESGKVIMAGMYYDSTDFNPSPTDSVYLPDNQFGANLFILKMDENGNYTWVNGITSDGFKSVGEIVVDKADNCYITGRFNDVTDFDSQFSHYSLTALQGNSSIYFGKYNATGALAWMKRVEHGYQGGQDQGLGIALDSKNDIYISGQFWGQGIDFNTSLTDTFLLGSNASNNYDAYLCKYSNTGAFKWAYNFGDSQEDQGNRVCIDATGSIYFATTVAFGSSGGPIDFDIDPINAFYYQPSGGYGDVAVTKFSQCVLDDAAVLTASGLSAFQGNVQYQWVNCGVGYAPISGATSQSFLPTTSGTYACILTSSASCKDTTVCLFYDVCANFSSNITTSVFGVMTASVANASSYQWLSCESNGSFTAIPSATSQSFTPTQNGSYACKVVKNGCTDTTACKSISNVGLADVALLQAVRLYPNPGTEEVTIEMPTSMNVQLVSVLGEEVNVQRTVSSGKIQFDIHEIPAGIYFVRCTKNHQTISYKFIKQ